MVRQYASVFPASSSQQRLWFLDRLEPSHAFYNMPVAMRMSTSVDSVALRRAINALVRRHESLRTSFMELDGHAFQVVESPTALPLDIVDLTHLSAVDRVSEAQRLTQIEAARPFDLARGPLLRVALLTLAENDHILLVTMHHIVADGWSFDLFFRELGVLYEARTSGRRARLPALRLQYPDFALWQRGWLAGPSREAELRYWRKQLADLPDVLSLPTDYPRPAQQRFQGGLVPIALPISLTQALKQLAQREDATLFMALLAGFQALLHRYTRADEVAVGCPIAGRHRDGLDGVVGLFANTLVMRARFDGDPTVHELLGRVRATAVGAYAHQDLPFEQLVADLAPRRTLGHQPLFQVLFGLQSVAGNGASPRRPSRLMVDTGTSKCDLTLSLTENADIVEGFFEYDTDLFDRATIDRLAGHFETLLTAMTEDPECCVSALSLLGVDERQQLVSDWNRTASPFSDDTPVHHLVEARASAAPAAIAISDGGTTVSYGELEVCANRLARHLASCGVRRGDRVGICLARSSAMIVAYLATLKAGAAYVPLDPTYPHERLSFIVADARVRIVIADALTRAHLERVSAEIVEIDAASVAPATAPAAAELQGGSSSKDSAYVIYTSGSTGVPKGVAVPHRAINRLIVNTNYIAIDASDCVAQASNASFDAATFEIWGALAHGARLTIITREVALDPHRFAAHLRAHRITVLFITTALFNQIVGEVPDAFRSLRCLLVGGEMANPDCFRDVLRHGAPGRMLHVYGPTETTTFATFHPVEDVPEEATTIPIGRPIANTRVYVVDGHLELVPVGVPGELVIAGDGVALGYWERPALTAEKFIAERWREGGGRAYRTGDLVRYRADGALEILGRLDDQVKIRGFRVEPGEVEAVLARHPAVREVAVVARTVGREQRLVAYVVADGEPAEAGLRAWLRERVPEYLVPAALMRLDRLPLTANGKVDRAALPMPRMSSAGGTKVAPRTAAETQLATIWAEVLGLDVVGIHDNFFELGGDSILSIQVLSRANRFGLRFTPKQLFQHQTIAELAPLAGRGALADSEQGPVVGDLPLTPIQRWFFAQDLLDRHHFNQAIVIDIPRETDATALETTVRLLLAHHDALRLRFHQSPDGWRQRLPPPDECSVVSTHDLAELGPDDRLLEFERIATALQGSLDLEHGPIIRVARITLDASRTSQLLIIAHHLAVDMVSWRILVEDMRLALRHATEGTPIELPRKTASFKSWAERLLSLAASAATREELSAWLDDHDGTKAVRLPTDFLHDEASNTVESRRELAVELDPAYTRTLLQAAPRAYRAQVPELLLAALLVALKEWTGDPTVVIDVEGHGRDLLGDELDVSLTVGWFTTIAPVRFRLDTPSDAGAAVEAVTRCLQALPHRGATYGLLRHLITDSSVRERLAARDTAQIAFNYLGQFNSADGVDPTSQLSPRNTGGPTRSARGRRRHLIDIDGGVVRGRLVMHWTFSQAFHRRGTIERVAHRFITALQRILDQDARPAGDAAMPDLLLAKLDQRQRENIIRTYPNAEDIYPLSPLQEGMLFHTLLTPHGGQYVVQMCVPMGATLDVKRFRGAWQTVVSRHPILRSAFAWEGLPRPLQLVIRTVDLPWDAYRTGGDWPLRRSTYSSKLISRARVPRDLP